MQEHNTNSKTILIAVNAFYNLFTNIIHPSTDLQIQDIVSQRAS